ncbi:MAG: hypothetical protein ACXWZB_04290, partial [Gaiellaceae bacterium]
MRRLLTVAGALALGGAVLGLSAVPAIGADSGAIQAKVVVATPCLTVTTFDGTSSLDHGTLPFTQPSATLGDYESAFGSGTAQYSNCGARSNVYAKGSDAVGPTATWALTDAPLAAVLNVCSLGTNVYRYSIGVSDPGSTTPIVGRFQLAKASKLVESLPQSTTRDL